MEELSPSILTHVYGFLPVIDIMRASAVCRRWSVPLWRDEEQVAMWHRHVLQALKENKIAVRACRSSIIKESFLRRELPYANTEEIVHFVQVVLASKLPGQTLS